MTVRQANQTEDRSRVRIDIPSFQRKDKQIPFDGFMYSPLVPNRIQGGRIPYWNYLMLPRFTLLDETSLSNHLTYSELSVKNHETRVTNLNNDSMVYA